MFENEDLEQVPREYKVNGRAERSEQYELVYIPEEADVKPLNPKSDPQAQEDYSATVSASNGFAKSLVAIFQTIYSCVTLYRARADQIGRYGYAAFGLTVAPYAVMSIVNLIGNLCTPDYAALHIVRSPDLVEADKRGEQTDAVIGVIDQLKGGTFDTNTWTGIFETVDYDSDTYGMRFERDKTELKAVIKIDQNADDGKGFMAETRLKRASRSSPMKYSWVRRLLSIIVILAPLCINVSISHFQPGASTPLQRGWTMSWLAVGITSCLGLADLFSSTYLVDEYHLRSDWIETAIFVLIVLVCGIPAIGGVVTVVQMLLEFGSCTRFD